jgi:hypothetical protein
LPAVVSIEAEYWQTATAEQRRAEETTAAKRFIATSLAKSVDKSGARIKELTTRDRDSPERPDFPEVLSACRATLIMSPCGDIRSVPPFGDVTTIEMSPNLEVSTGGQIGKDSHEQRRIRRRL